MTWKTADGIKEASKYKPQLETLLKGMLQPATLLDLIRNFIVFEKSKREDAKTGLIQIQTVKKLAAYHQYYAVNKAVQSSIVASGIHGDKRGGVVWHTQGSGKSLSMVFYSGKLISSPEMRNPTIVVITDRNDLDGEGKLSGSLVSLDRHTAQAVLEAAGLDADAFADSPVFELRIDRAAWQQLDQATETWVSLVWDPTHGQRSFRRAGLGGERVPV
jgi:hypothetical protein